MNKRVKELAAELEPQTRQTIQYNWDPLPDHPTLMDAMHRAVTLKLRNGTTVTGILQSPRESVVDKDALRIIPFGKEFKTRIIPKKWITSGTVEGKDLVLDNVKKIWVVTGSKGDQYTVTRDNYKWTCNCPAGKWKKGDCKHVREIKAKLAQ